MNISMTTSHFFAQPAKINQQHWSEIICPVSYADKSFDDGIGYSCALLEDFCEDSELTETEYLYNLTVSKVQEICMSLQMKSVRIGMSIMGKNLF